MPGNVSNDRLRLSRGVLAGILNTVASEIIPRSPELVGWEAACSADQHDHCRFEFGEEKVLLAEALLPPQGKHRFVGS